MLRADLAHQELSDIRLVPARRADSVLVVDRRATETGWDLDTEKDLDAVGQAAWLALAIPRGTLSQLGHPRFGSRLHLLIGENLNEQTIARARAYIREALRNDTRFRLIDVDILRNPADPGALDAQIVIDPGGALTFPLAALIAGETDAAGAIAS
ncbi:hypothetical protein [Yoonia sp. SS1-5]|uniref:IraD/Gp25-like domain-containing protein n=1 Tax=Yoonia rhodophyticola TaxID=3137370 RepID=A0AAN0MHV5_9RHOB